MNRSLESLLAASAGKAPASVAVEDPTRGCLLTYGRLNELASQVSSTLVDLGVATGDRVGIYAPKSCGSVAAIFGVLRASAGYVPVDYTAPVERNAYIFSDCTVRAVVVERSLLAGLATEMNLNGETAREIGSTDELGVDLVILPVGSTAGSSADFTLVAEGDQLAYILYTSGSTGKPKGVVHTHASALAFVDWCSEKFEPVASDKFSSHASFHFDLSILDLYVPIKHGASIVIIGEDVGKQPAVLAPLIADAGITMWYSTPSILRLLVEMGKLEEHDYSRLRVVNFAGEVFPIKHLRSIKAIWKHPRYFNLYGPTETNVCTYFEIPADFPEARTEPFPIGYACSGDRTAVMDVRDNPVEPGQTGELYVTGGSVMQGYWNLPERTASAFFVDEHGERWYRTGDVVLESSPGCYEFVGRRDRMVKRRGYRIELGEIESALYRHEGVSEAAVVAVPDDTSGVRISAFVKTRDGQRIGLIAMKSFCAKNLPLYMIPDKFDYLEQLPKTSTDKVDYQKLAGLA